MQEALRSKTNFLNLYPDHNLMTYLVVMVNRNIVRKLSHLRGLQFSLVSAVRQPALVILISGPYPAAILQLSFISANLLRQYSLENVTYMRRVFRNSTRSRSTHGSPTSHIVIKLNFAYNSIVSATQILDSVKTSAVLVQRVLAFHFIVIKPSLV